MYGFIIGVNGEVKSNSPRIDFENNCCVNNMIHKFQEDKVFAETRDFIVVLDGVILNKTDLLKDFNSDWPSYLIKQYEDRGEVFFSVLRGSFSGALYDKHKKLWIIFTDQLGTKFLYYSLHNKTFVCAGEMKSISNFLRDNNLPVLINPLNASLLLSYGFMVSDKTILDCVKKIQPGCYLLFDGENVIEKSYYTLNNLSDRTIDINNAIERVDVLFRNAVNLSFKKDDEYGYKHIVALSGGLDARMVSFVAHSLGYKDQLNITFSQSGYLDQTIPQEMAAYLKHEWLFKALDNGLWLFDVDRVTEETGGNLLYYGVAHGRSLMKCLNFEDYGIAHSGQLGDVSLSSHYDPSQPYSYGLGAFASNNSKSCSFDTNVYPERYANMEIGVWYTRYLNAINNGIQYLYNYTESVSPFLDLDFLEYVLSIPYSLRKEHSLYKKWIIKKYPDAAQFVWEKIQAKITAPMVRIGKKGSFALTDIPSKVLSKLHIKKTGINSLEHMNPYGYYIATNLELKKYLMNYFRYVELIKEDELRKQVLRIRDSGSPIELLQAVSLLAAYKMYSVD